MGISGNPQGTGKEIVALTSLRGLAALCVVAVHVCGHFRVIGWVSETAAWFHKASRFGGFSVDLFFILSGYILAASYGAETSFQKFASRRIARLVPLHLFVLAVMALTVGSLESAGVRPVDPENYSWSALPYYAALVAIWFSMPPAWNVPSWSIEAEMAANAGFPMLQNVVSRLPQTGLWLAAAAAAAADMVVLQQWTFATTGAPALARAMFGFSLGVCVFHLCKRLSVNGALALPAACALLAALYFGSYPVAILSVALLIATLGVPSRSLLHRAMEWRPLHFTGEISYSIYLVHLPILFVYFGVAVEAAALRSKVGVALTVACYFVVVLAVSVVTFMFVEAPARRAIKGWRRAATT